MTAIDALQRARQLQADRRFGAAEAVYRQILATDPNHADALQGLGWLAHEAGNHPAAMQLLERALEIRPTDFMLHWQIARVSERAGNVQRADTAYARACELKPKENDLLMNWGVFLAHNKKLERALEIFRRVAKFFPDSPFGPYNAGLALEQLNRLAEAEAAFRDSLGLSKGSADTLQSLALVLGKMGRFEESLDFFKRALEIDPSHFNANFNLAFLYRSVFRYEDADAPLERARAMRPTSSMAMLASIQNFINLGRHRQALQLIDQALVTHPNDSNLHGHRALSLLALGHLAEGFREYEHRWNADRFPQNRRFSHAPQWTGFDIAGKTILLHAEQGFGDTFQFVRYAPLIAQRGARVLLHAQNEVLSLLNTVEGIAHTIAPDQLPPAFDVQCPMLSLPYAFGTTLQTIPTNIPYLHATDEKVQQWRPRLEAPAGKRKIGLVWAGRPTHIRDSERSISLELLKPLAAVETAHFFSLQKGKAAAERVEGFDVMPLGAELKDFTDTAAVIAQLDLLISVDTAVVHLAGAMGKPVWTLIGSFTDFRWMLDREDSPWYPSMRLFRQQRRGDWEGLIDRVVKALEDKSE